ncbi:MAG TPA: HisA/HisF-related TIM barrel protein, partial [Rhodopila sp.]|nr:HisA/HisF-related TIM barrel protein [Rhodopila sp.]
GPDTERVSALVARSPATRVFGAGGVRHAADITALATAGAAGVLVATALHTGALTAADLAQFGGR